MVFGSEGPLAIESPESVCRVRTPAPILRRSWTWEGGGIAGVTFGPIPAEMKGCTSCQSPAAYVELRMWKGRGPIFPSRSQGICPTLMSGSANAEILKRILERFPRSL